MVNAKLDEVDKRLLQLAQDEFPVAKRPWARLGDKLNLAEEEVLLRLKRLHGKGIVRKIGPIVDAERLGLKASTLIAMKVPKAEVERAAKIINEYEGVSHNYVREHKYNVWFTIAASSEEELRKTLEEIKRRVGASDEDTLNLPAKRKFKLDVRFRLI